MTFKYSYLKGGWLMLVFRALTNINSHQPPFNFTVRTLLSWRISLHFQIDPTNGRAEPQSIIRYSIQGRHKIIFRKPTRMRFIDILAPRYISILRAPERKFDRTNNSILLVRLNVGTNIQLPIFQSSFWIQIRSVQTNSNTSLQGLSA